MASLPLTAVLQLAVAHAPGVAPETIATFAQTESRMNPYALYDNTTRTGHAPRTAAEASALARSLLDRGHSIDTGLMQINSANFRITGLDHVTAFDPARSVEAGAAILTEAYTRCKERGLNSDPLRCMASIYNTGRATAGERNGYVGRIFAAADLLVPEIRKAVEAQPLPVAPTEERAPPAHGCGPPPPSWDGWAAAAHKRCVKKPQSTQDQAETNKDEIQ